MSNGCLRLVMLAFLVGAALRFNARVAHAGFFYSGTSPANIPWPGGVISYQFDAGLTAAQTNTYLDGIREWELAANVTFIPRSNQTQYILFKYDPSGPNQVSGTNPQVVEVNSLSRAQVAHEVGHSLGFTHENIRPDQTNYLVVLSNNVAPGQIGWFVIDPSGVTNGAYDFESVMHLGRNFASINPALDTQQARPGYERFQPRMGNYALSIGDRAAARFLYGPPAVPLTNIVTTTRDGGPGSLRAALYYAMDHPGTTITFNIPPSDPGYSNGVFNLKLTGHLPPPVTDGTVIDGSTQPGFAGNPLIFVDGSEMLPESVVGSVSGLLIYAANCAVKNLSFTRFNWNGLTLLYADATNNTIAGCWYGLDATGTNRAPNAYQGILISSGASRNIIGGTNALARNVLSGNSQYGVLILETNTTGNVVLGNYIGVNPAGGLAISNAVAGVGIWGGARSNVLGGTIAGAGNLISGNPYGVFLSDSNTFRNSVLGNFIGTDASGTAAIPNDYGIGIFSGARTNAIGGVNLPSGIRNLISGNRSYGIVIAGDRTSFNMVQGNYIGSDLTGSNAVPNTTGIGIWGGATNNSIGGPPTANFGNLISGNFAYGVLVADPGTRSNTIAQNYIGTVASGQAALPNGTGVGIFGGATRNQIGNGLGGNLISGNQFDGVLLADATTSENSVQANRIGLNWPGTATVPNGFSGVAIVGGAKSNIVGGVSLLRNVIAGNGASGVYLADAGTSGNVIQGNYVGTDLTGNLTFGNGAEGIAIFGGAASNLIGGATSTAGNVIGGSTYRGIFMADTNTTGNLIQGNLIGVGANGLTPLPNGFEGIAIANGAGGNIIGLALDGSGRSNRIAYSAYNGIYVGYFNQSGTAGNTIRGNSIHANGYLGINLTGGIEDFNGVTANDASDTDDGPNHLQNYPVITNAFAYPASTTVRGSLNSTSSRTFLIDVYRNVGVDPSGSGEGENYLGSTTLTTDSNGNGSFSFTASGNFAGQHLTATATDFTTADTSEFSLAVLATNAPAPPEFLAPFTLTSTGFVATASLTIGQSYRIQAATNLAMIPIPWVDLTNFTASTTNYLFLDRAATNRPMRFYRVVSP